MSVTFCLAVSEGTFRDGAVFPPWNPGDWVIWRQAAEDHEEAAIAVNKQILAGLVPHECFAAYVWREGEETSKARKFWFFNLFVSEHQPSTEEQQALRIAELEAELASCKAELQQAQAEAAAVLK